MKAHAIERYASLFVAVWMLLAGPMTVTAQPDAVPASPRPVGPPPQAPHVLASPQATVFTFLEAINRASSRDEEGHWNDVYACMQLSQASRQRAHEAALELWGVLNRLETIDESTPLPDAQWAARNRLSSYTYFPADRFDRTILQRAGDTAMIALVRTPSGAWKFSAETVAGIHDLYTNLSELPIVGSLTDERLDSVALWLRSNMPRYLKHDQVLALEYWQWLGLLVLILMGVTLDHTVRFGLGLLTNRVLARRHASARKETVAVAVRPLGLLAAGLLWLGLLWVLNLPDQPLLVLLTAVRLFTVLAGTWAAWCFSDLISEILSVKAQQTKTKFDDVLIPLLRKTAKVLIVAFGLIYGARALNIPVLPMLTSLGIGGLAFAFAAKDTIENFFGSVAVILDRPFEVGDWVVIGDVEGTVEEVGFRSTRIRTFYNSQVTVPNATLVRATVDNYGRRRYRRIRTHIGIQYDTPPDKIVAFTEGIRELVRSHPYTRKDYYQVWFHEFGPSSLNVLLYVFHETPDWATELRERERLFLDIVRLADQLDVKFAFPTQTVHLYHEDANVTHHASPPPGESDDARAGQRGAHVAHRLVENQPWRRSRPGPVVFHEGPNPLIGELSENPIEDRDGSS